MHCYEERGKDISAMIVVRLIITTTIQGLFTPRIILIFKLNMLENKHLGMDNVTVLCLLFLVRTIEGKEGKIIRCLSKLS
jgi:hypothetical protein